MMNKYGEAVEAMLATTNGWYNTAILSCFAGTDGLVAVRNAFSTSDKKSSPEEYAAEQQVLKGFLSNYSETLYAENGTDEVGTAWYRVKDQGNVYVVAKLAATNNDGKKVLEKSFSGSVAGGLVYDEKTGSGSTSAALRNSKYLWSTEVVYNPENGTVSSAARYICPNAADKTQVVDEDEIVGTK